MSSEQIHLVGIINATDNSFSPVGRYGEAEAHEAVQHASELRREGAAIVDVGAEATNPMVTTEQDIEVEWQRLEPIITELFADSHYGDLSVSLDTRHAEVARRAAKLANGKRFYLNDVTTFLDEEMIDVVLDNDLSAIVSHSPLAAHGDLQRIHHDETIRIDSVEQVVEELLDRRERMEYRGISQDRIILDPGIGFGKTKRIDHRLVRIARFFPQQAVMVAASQKKLLLFGQGGRELDIDPAFRFQDEPNQHLASIAIAAALESKSPLYLRVHNPEIYRDLLA